MRDVKDFLNIGEVVDLLIKEKIYRTKLQDVYENRDEFLISHPYEKSLPVFLHVRQQITCIIYRKDGVYEFDAKVVALPRRNDTRECVLEPVSELLKLQRRAFYRLEGLMGIPVQLDVTWEEDRTETFQSEIIDLSATGVKLKCFRPLETAANVDVIIELEEDTTMLLSAEVVRVEEHAMASEPNAVALQFTDHDADAQNYLSQFILRKQIERRLVE